MTPDDLLPPAVPAAVPAVDDERRYRICDGCGCKLTRHGEIVSIGDKYKAMQRSEKTIAERDERIAELEKDNRELRAKLAEHEGASREKGSGLLI